MRIDHGTYPTLFWEDVQPGAEINPFVYELSLLRLVAFVRASGLYDFVHFDGDYARVAGARDAFISTPHVAGLFSRLCTDWAGPGANLRKLTFRMNTQTYRNDILTISGKVGEKSRGSNGEYLVELVDLNIATQDVPRAAGATALIELESRTGVQPAAVRPTSNADATPGDDMPEFARALLGVVKEGKKEPARPLTEDEIHLWCEALEDWNPLYWDRDYAATSRYGGIIAPHVGMFYGIGNSIEAGVGYGKPGVRVPDAVDRGLTGVPLLQALRQGLIEAGSPFSPPGCPEVAVTQATLESFAPLRVGDTLRTEQRLLNCSQMKRTKLGEGYFLTYQNALINQRDELVKTLTMSLFYYHV